MTQKFGEENPVFVKLRNLWIILVLSRNDNKSCNLKNLETSGNYDLGRAISYGSYFYNPNSWFSGILLFFFQMLLLYMDYVNL